MIHVCYGINDNDGHFSKFCGTSICSLFENTSKPVTIHILHDNTLTGDNRDKFMYLAGQYHQAIKFYNVEELEPSRLEDLRRIHKLLPAAPYTIAALYRLLIPSMFPSLDKIIYIDAGDTLVNLDIDRLWQSDVKDYPLAALPETTFNIHIADDFPLCKAGIVKRENYFNTGVLLMNLDYLRQKLKLILDGEKIGRYPDIYELLREHPDYFSCHDQDVLNVAFSEQYLKLPLEFNCMVMYHKKI